MNKFAYLGFVRKINWNFSNPGLRRTTLSTGKQTPVRSKKEMTKTTDTPHTQVATNNRAKTTNHENVRNGHPQLAGRLVYIIGMCYSMITRLALVTILQNNQTVDDKLSADTMKILSWQRCRCDVKPVEFNV